ncbi:MAG: AfsR/SARP family transcriptional regulator [Nocardioidaceae bacterium]
MTDVTERAELQLFGCWELRVGDGLLELSHREQRLVALLALTGRRPRAQVAGVLWPEAAETHAMASLRAAVWRTNHALDGLLAVNRSTIALDLDVACDVVDLVSCAERTVVDPHAVPFDTAVTRLRRGDLLPGWYEDWVLFERERLKHLRMRAFESLAVAGLRSGCPHESVVAAREMTALEPLHETGQFLLLQALLAAGQSVEALRQYHSYARRVGQDLGTVPSPSVTDLVRPLLVPAQGHRPADAVPWSQQARG